MPTLQSPLASILVNNIMQPDFLHPSWLQFDSIDSSHTDNVANILDSNLSFSVPYATMSFAESKASEVHSIHWNNCSFEVEELSSFLNNEIFEISENSDAMSDFCCHPQQSAMDVDCEGSFVPSFDQIYDISLHLQAEDWETDIQESIYPLLMAFAEAMEKDQTALGEVLMKRLHEKLNPFGGSLERVLYYFLQSNLMDKKFHYLKQEATKNFHVAFKTFYQMFPYGKFAHFSANAAILETIPCDAEIIQIFDFDMGDGVQWPPIIEAIGPQQKELRLTTIKQDNDHWKFEDRKKRLCDHARAAGVKLTVDEIDLNDLSKFKRANKDGEKKEWLAFNCMVSLPHMGRIRRRKDVMVFLSMAEELLSCNNDGNCKGLITVGDGDAWKTVNNYLNFSSLLNGCLVHYQTLLESIECNFPSHLSQGRIAMECLFVAPFLSSLVWNGKGVNHENVSDLNVRLGFEGIEVSQRRLTEASELVNEGNSLYGVRIEGDDDNEIVLEWANTPLVKVSCWKI